VIRAAEREVRAEQAAGRQASIVAVGRKARNYFGYRRYTIDESFTGFSESPTYNDAKAVADFVLERFEAEDYHQVRLAYTRFLSVGRQQAVVAPYMPLELEGIGLAREESQADYEYEPDPTEILERLLPRYAEARLFAAMLESTASFYAAQQRAMKAATDNAEDLITKLTRAMNRARQEAITTEIMEIVGGAEALRQAGARNEEVAPALALQDLLPEDQRVAALSSGS
jgi:F-type H+-transporting ATPase subunit gamma